MIVHTGIPHGSQFSPMLFMADRTSQADLLCDWNNRMGFGSKDSLTGVKVW